VKQRVLAFGALQLLGVGIIFVMFDPPSLIPFPTLQLHGNPLEYLPELSPCTQLRSVSLANVRIMADATFTR
jgi:hypothetical protein